MTTPTVESVATMQGRELDAAVCERVFGEPVQWGGHRGDVPLWKGRDRIVPHYSTNPAAFFALMEKVRENGWRVSIEEASGSFRGKHKWRVTLTDKSGWLRHGFGNDLPLAFARAALLTTINTPKGG